VVLALTYQVNTILNTTIRNCAIQNYDFGVFFNGSSNNTILNITAQNNTLADIFTGEKSNNTLILTKGGNNITFSRTLINVTDIDNIFINESIVAVNSSAEQIINTSANITMSVSVCPQFIMFREGFFTEVDDVILSGQRKLCDETNLCHDIQCDSNVLTFNVDHFSTYAATPCIPPVNGFNITSNITMCPGTFNLVNGVNINASDIVVTCNQTVLFDFSPVKISARVLFCAVMFKIVLLDEPLKKTPKS